MTALSRRRALAVLGSGIGLLAGATIPAVASARPDVPKPPPGVGGVLTAITTVPHSSRAMAVGTTGNFKPDNGYFALIKSAGRWRKIAAPVLGGRPGEVAGEVDAVAAGSASTIWAGGAHAPNDSSRQPAIWRWTGKTWASQTLPDLPVQQFPVDGFDTSIDSISASSATNAWAVGNILNSSGQPTSLHWDGKTWSQIPLPVTATKSGPPDLEPPVLVDVSTTGPANAWAVEEVQASSAFTIVRFVHGKWVVSKRIPQGTDADGIATGSKKLTYVPVTVDVSANERNSYLLRFNGSTWSKVTLPAADQHLTLTRLTMHGSSIWLIARNAAYSYTIIHSTGRKWTTELSLPTGWSLDTISAESSSQALAGGVAAPSVSASGKTYVTESNGSKWTAQSSK
jgi:hypothetical protein